MTSRTKKFIACLLLDAIGYISYTLPLVGEYSDILWAPIAALISYRMFGKVRGKYTAITTFTEEILPFTDIIPSFTIFFLIFDWLGIRKPTDRLHI